MKLNALSNLTIQGSRLVGTAMLIVCVTIVAASQQQKPVRVFLLEGVGMGASPFLDSKLAVDVVRDGKTIKVYPGDELREGDRIKADRQTGNDLFRGASVVIYDDEDRPAYIVGYHRGVDFTLSKLRFAGHAMKVEIVNHVNTPLIIEHSNTVDRSPLETVDIYKEDGTRGRYQTQSEYDNFELSMDLDHEGQRDARWTRADRMIKEGRKAAEKEYRTLVNEWKNQADGSGPKGGACTMVGVWTQTTPGIGTTDWDIKANGKAKETGIGYAEGDATLKGNVLHIDWHTVTGYSGYYEWTLGSDCSTSVKGTLQFKTGRTDSLNSSVRKK